MFHSLETCIGTDLRLEVALVPGETISEESIDDARGLFRVGRGWKSSTHGMGPMHVFARSLRASPLPAVGLRMCKLTMLFFPMLLGNDSTCCQ